MGKKVLGLDLGPNSIGWAIVELKGQDDEPSLVDMGVRVFTEGVDQFDTSKETSRNETRRTARAMRRQTKRRVLRRRRLTAALISVGLWPADTKQQTELLQKDPYELRSRAIDPNSELSLFELGRVFLTLARRRGFQSNKKTDKGKEASELLQEIKTNENERASAGYATLGAWLYAKSKVIDHRERKPDDEVRGRHLSRKEYLDEFNLIWETQKAKYPNRLTDELRYGSTGEHRYPCVPIARTSGRASILELYGIHGLVFFQRKMYWRTSVIGRCELEPKLKRAPLADRRVQLFRILQEVNNLCYVDPKSRESSRLSEAQRKLLIDKLVTEEKMSFDEIRKTLGMHEGVRFNLEKGERSNLKGHRTDSLIAKKKHFGPEWLDLDDSLRSEIVEFLLDPNLDEFQFAERAGNTWMLSPKKIEALLSVDLPPGYGALSIKAIQKLLPFLQKGMIYSSSSPENSAIGAAGYLRRDQLKRRIFDYLPDPLRTKNSPIGNIPNPIVKRTLTEVRKLVNAIVREYGKPDDIHVEMARSLQMGATKRREISAEMRKRETAREEIAKRIKEAGQRPTRDNILRYQLWLEQNKTCLYSGKPISQSQLFSITGGIDVDHILPRSRTLDDSQSNKVLCFRQANAEKGNRTPYEWLAKESPERYAEVTDRVLKLMKSSGYSFTKYQKFVLKDLKLDDFIARQLVDTAYITRAASEYLRCLFDGDHHVLGLKGRLTSELRWRWGLETILEEIPDSPAWAECANLRPGEKNRADHRHHSIDALIVALTNRSALQKLSNSIRFAPASKQSNEADFPSPWPGFRQEIREKVASLWVSHRVERKVSGRLHEDTLYGETKSPGEWVIRKSIESLSLSEVERIRDSAIRKMVLNRLAENGIEVGRGKKFDSKKVREVLSKLTMTSGVPIKKVRILKNEETIRPIRSGGSVSFVKPGSTHHICIFEWESGGKRKRAATFVSMLEATQRLKEGQAVIQRFAPDNHPAIPRHAQFLMSLSSRELLLQNKEGRQTLLLYRTAASTQGQIYFTSNSDARRSDSVKKIACNANTLEGQKVTVDMLGRIRWAND
jgi:CRISPR-associated endonuclease Csn1